MKLTTTKENPVRVMRFGAMLAGNIVANFVQKGFKIYFEVKDLS